MAQMTEKGSARMAGVGGCGPSKARDQTQRNQHTRACPSEEMAEVSMQQAEADEAEDGGWVGGPRGVVLGLSGLMMEATFGRSNTGAKDEYGTLRTRPIWLWHCTQTAARGKREKVDPGEPYSPVPLTWKCAVLARPRRPPTFWSARARERESVGLPGGPPEIKTDPGLA